MSGELGWGVNDQGSQLNLCRIRCEGAERCAVQ